MIRDSITVQEVAEFLNEVAADDPKALRSLLLLAIGCNQTLAENPKFNPSKAPDGSPALGLAALLDSVFGFDEDGRGAFDFKVGKRSVAVTPVDMPADPEKYADQRNKRRIAGDWSGCEYTFDEKRVVKYLTDVRPGVGAGGDPIGFLIASHAALNMKTHEQGGPCGR